MPSGVEPSRAPWPPDLVRHDGHSRAAESEAVPSSAWFCSPTRISKKRCFIDDFHRTPAVSWGEEGAGVRRLPHRTHPLGPSRSGPAAYTNSRGPEQTHFGGQFHVVLQGVECATFEIPSRIRNSGGHESSNCTRVARPQRRSYHRPHPNRPRTSQPYVRRVRGRRRRRRARRGGRGIGRGEGPTN